MSRQVLLHAQSWHRSRSKFANRCGRPGYCQNLLKPRQTTEVFKMARVVFGPVYLSGHKTFMFTDSLEMVRFTGSAEGLRPSKV